MDAPNLNPENTNPHPVPEFLEQIEALKEALAEAEDLAAEFAMDMRMEAKRAQLEVERLSRELTDT